MKKLVIFANCQSGAVAKTLLENEAFAGEYEWEVVAPVQSLRARDVRDVVGKVRTADLFIYQPVLPSPQRPEEMTHRYLLGQLKDGATTLSFPPIYFDGYFPHLATMNGMAAALNLAHDYILAYACAIGVDEDACHALLNREDLYSRQLSEELADQSLKQLEERERKDGLDITIADHIRKEYRKRRLFTQFNHPTRPLLKYLADSMLKKLGFGDDTISAEGRTYLAAIKVPIYRSTYRNLGLAFPEDFDAYIGAGHVKLKQRQVIEEMYAFYRETGLDEIKQFVLRKKPFVAGVVEAHV